MAVRASGL